MDNRTDMAAALEVEQLWIKDESERMGMGSFKAVGGAFAVARILQKTASARLGKFIEPKQLLDESVREIAAENTFITASAGNHGLSVAAGARIFGAHACVVLSASVPHTFEQRLQQIPCTVVRAGNTYEESINYAIKTATQNNWRLLADGSWPGYTDTPAMVMEGYSVIPEECMALFSRINCWPSHIFLQAGVGGLAASFSGHVRSFWPNQPKIIIVESEAAPCLMESIRQGKLTTVKGPVSIMGRLDCKDASLLAFEALRYEADVFVTVSDSQARREAESFSSLGLPTTASGIAGLCALHQIRLNDKTSSRLKLDRQSRCLVIVSEGT